VTDLVWDTTGARYYETGVSKAILWTMSQIALGAPGVVWNGLISISLDPSGGEYEPYYIDGKKYMERILAEEFQATLTVINTPKEFEPCEGIKTVTPGMKTHFKKREKFNLCWRTEIGSDTGENVGYRIHIAYNCTAQPSSRNYQTIADSTTMDQRSIVVTATPACGRDSYFSFDSREHDLSALEAQINQGILPLCSDLAGIVGSSESPCPALLMDFEMYNPGQTVEDDTTLDGSRTVVSGIINNGLVVTELPATGAFAANDSAASTVGTGDILNDDDDATYVTSADGDLGYTIGLPSLVGYREGATFELHIRASISGGVSADDPDNIDADMQVHISTDATGDTTIGGFSDGTDEGMGFALSVVDGTPLDYTVPLKMDAWVDTTLDDVVAALQTGAYLNVVGASNNNPSTTPEVRVYEASVVMLDATVQARALMSHVTPGDDGLVEQFIYSTGTTVSEAASTSYVDFLITRQELDTSVDGYIVTLIGYDGAGPGALEFSAVSGPTLKWNDEDTSTTLMNLVPQLNRWYRAKVYWDWDGYQFTLYDIEAGMGLIEQVNGTTSNPPTTHVKHYSGIVGSTTATYHTLVDNARLDVDCHVSAPVGTPTILHPGAISWDLPSGIFDTGTVTGSLPLQDNSDTTYIGIETDGDGSAVTYINRATAPIYEPYSGTPSSMTVRVRAQVTSNDPAGGARFSLAIEDSDGSPAVVISPGTSDWILPDTGSSTQDFTLVMTDAYFAHWGTSLAAIAAVIAAGTAKFVIQSNVSTVGPSVHTFVRLFNVEVELD